MSSAPAKRENMLLNLVCNLVVPTLVLTKFSTDKWLGPVWGLVVALAFPIGYGIYDYVERRKMNFLSILGFGSVLLSGGLGLLGADGFWFSVKEAAVPTLIGLAVLISLRTKTPLIRELLLNEQVLDVKRVEAALDERNARPGFNGLMKQASIWLSIAFIGSAVLNFGLARYLLKSPPHTPEFNAELGKMHMLSWPVIVLPSMVVMMFVFFKIVKGLSALTGLTQDEIFKMEPAKPKTPAQSAEEKT